MTSQVRARSVGLRPFTPADQASEFADLDFLHRISVELIGEHDLDQLYGKIVDAAVSITRSQFGTMQLLCPKDDPSGREGQLQLLCHRGLPPDAIDYWRWVKPSARSSCTLALKVGQRALVPDFERWDEIAGTADLMAFRRVGIRSAQTTPLLSRSGQLLGMISTHWSEPHQPSDRDLRLLDILARQAADILERTIAENALRRREAELELACEALRESEHAQKMLAGEMNHRVKNLFALVNTMIRFGAKSAQSKDEFASSLSGRLLALARAHELVLAGGASDRASEFRSILRSVIEPHQTDGRQRFALAGDPVLMKPDAISGLALIFNELATNATKYGALAANEGAVAIDWHVEDDALEVRWQETGGMPIASAPEHSGFGSRLLDSTIVRQFGGQLSYDWRPHGVLVAIRLPLSSIAG